MKNEKIRINSAESFFLSDVFVQELAKFLDPLLKVLPLSRLSGGVIVNMEVTVLCIILIEP
jgi:hypothetical protein